MTHASPPAPALEFAFDPGRSVGSEYRRIVRRQLDLAQDEIHSRELDGDLAVHTVRKRLKRIRALLRLVRLELGSGFAETNHRIRDAGRRLSPLRDANVVLATLDSLRAAPGPWLNAGNRSLLAGLEQTLALNHDGVRAGTRFRRALNAAGRDLAPLEQSLKRVRFKNQGFQALEPGLVRSYGQGRTAMTLALQGGGAEAFHQWRKRVKDHWHHCELLAPGWRAGLVPRSNRMHHLSDALGSLQDLAVLLETSSALADSTRRGSRAAACHGLLQRLAQPERERLMEEAGQLGRGLYRRRAESLGESVARHWGAETAAEATP